MRSTTETVKIENRMEIFCLPNRRKEVPILYEQVKEYLKHGIQLKPGDLVFDIGANIGLFTLYLHHLFQGTVKSYAFEPIPELYEILKLNTERFSPTSLRSFPYGLSQESSTKIFTYYPNASPMSTTYPEDPQVIKEKFKLAVLNNYKEGPPAFKRLGWFPPFLREPLLDHELRNAFQAETVSCQLKTISEVIQTEKVLDISLLKIDVEKSELDVLLGIEEADWPKIQQVVVEVHDLEGRLETIMGLLKSRGFTGLTVEQEPILKGSDVFSVYGLRH